MADARNVKETVIELQGVHKAFDQHRILEGLDLSVRSGETLVILGRSGIGKSVALRHIVGLMAPDRGSVRVFGKDLAELDADVISIEASRSDMQLLHAFVRTSYPSEIGPGVYDIHSPRVPSAEEMEDLLAKATAVLTPQQVWVNPDCGLKTRGWDEVERSLKNMVTAAKNMRAKVAQNLSETTA